MRLVPAARDFNGDGLFTAQCQAHQKCRDLYKDPSEANHWNGIQWYQLQFFDESQGHNGQVGRRIQLCSQVRDGFVSSSLLEGNVNKRCRRTDLLIVTITCHSARSRPEHTRAGHSDGRRWVSQNLPNVNRHIAEPGIDAQCESDLVLVAVHHLGLMDGDEFAQVRTEQRWA